MSEKEKYRLQNIFNKYLLLISILSLALILGAMWLGWEVTLWFIGISSILFILAPKASPKLIMRWQSATKINTHNYPDLHNLIYTLASRAGLKVFPEIYFIPKNNINAFAIGTKSKPVLGITAGLIRLLNDRQLAGVLAHEISHIKNNDLFFKNLAHSFGNFANSLSLIGRILLIINLPLLFLGYETISWVAILLLIFTPFIIMLLQMALSRSMEYLADSDAGEITGDPHGLASALQRIDDAQRPWWHLWQPNVKSNEWLSSHPETKKRIQKLISTGGSEHQNPTNGFHSREYAHPVFRNF